MAEPPRELKITDRQSRQQRRRRWVRFGMRFLFLFMTGICVWIAVISNAAKRQRQAIRRIEELNGLIAFDHQFDGNMNWRKAPNLPAPGWLVDMIGEDYVRRVAIINFDDGSNPSNEDLAVIAGLTSVRQLTLTKRRQISDDGLRHVARLTNLEVLALNGTNVQGKGLRNIRNLRSLKGLTLDDTPLTDEGLKHIAELPQLEWLHLSNTEITNDGLRDISSLPRLEDLQLRGTSITDEGVRLLSGMTSLKRILLGDSVSKEACAWLQEQLPGCKVAN